MDALQSFLADFTRVEDEVVDRTTLRVCCVCLDPSSVGWKTSSYSAIAECLDSRSWCCELIWRENLTV